MTDKLIEYSANNSGGVDWISQAHWDALAGEGWEVRYNDLFRPPKPMSATKRFEHINEAVEEWSRITGLDPLAEGCGCCGRPHYFTADDGDDENHIGTVEGAMLDLVARGGSVDDAAKIVARSKRERP